MHPEDPNTRGRLPVVTSCHPQAYYDVAIIMRTKSAGNYQSITATEVMSANSQLTSFIKVQTNKVSLEETATPYQVSEQHASDWQSLRMPT